MGTIIWVPVLLDTGVVAEWSVVSCGSSGERAGVSWIWPATMPLNSKEEDFDHLVGAAPHAIGPGEGSGA